MTQRGVIQSVWWGSVCRSVGYGLAICGGGGAVLAVCICTNGMHMHMHVHMQDARPGGVHTAIEKRLLCGA